MRRLDPEAARGLRPDHPALTEKRTIFTSLVVDPDDAPRLLERQDPRTKLGSAVEKGAWRGFPIFGLTLEERATCPTSCHHWSTCFGNSTHRARRHRHGPRLITRLRYELMMLQKKHPIGFVVRLHILGDFWSVEYVRAWEAWLDLFPALRVFGYTAHPEASEIGAEIVRIRESGWGRFAMRTSAVEPGPTRAITIDHIPNSASIVEGTVCPQQLGLTRTCGSCALCWSPAMKDKTIAFVRHGMKRRGAVAH